MSLGTKIKDPDDVRLYSFDWSAELDDDTISSSSWELDSPLVSVTEAIGTDERSTTVAVSGGVHGENYEIRNTIIRTSSGETISKSGIIAVRNL